MKFTLKRVACLACIYLCLVTLPIRLFYVEINAHMRPKKSLLFGYGMSYLDKFSRKYRSFQPRNARSNTHIAH